MIALKIALCVFLLLLLAPRKFYPWAIAITVPTYVWLYWIISRPLPFSDGWGALGRGIILIAMVLSMSSALVRFLLDKRRSNIDLLPDLDWRPAQVSCLFVAIWGGAWLLTPAIPMFAGAVTCVAVTSLVSFAMFGAARFIPGNRLLFSVAGIALISGIPAILMWPTVVIAAAERRASGKPYCLVVAHGGNYRTAQALLDLTPIVMRGRESNISASNFHGELIIGDDRRNWSYKFADFREKAGDHTPPRCEAKIGFARNLPWF